MSLGYASRLSYREDLGGQLGAPELFDNANTVKSRVKELAEIVRNARRVVAFTGAGISTSCGVPDFRGPDGIWTLQRAGKPLPKLQTSFTFAKPSFTHQALLALMQSGKLTHICSQNVDGLHLRSGVRRNHLSELHGNCFAERCPRCGAEYIRTFEMQTVGFKVTGRSCSASGCRGRLRDQILDWEDALPDDELKKSQDEAAQADLSLCLGTSLQITPACDIPLFTTKAGGKLVIVNLQKTPKDKHASLLLHAKVDQVMALLMLELGIQVPRYERRDSVTVTHSASWATARTTWQFTLDVCSPDGANCPIPMVKACTITFLSAAPRPDTSAPSSRNGPSSSAEQPNSISTEQPNGITTEQLNGISAEQPNSRNTPSNSVEQPNSNNHPGTSTEQHDSAEAGPTGGVPPDEQQGAADGGRRDVDGSSEKKGSSAVQLGKRKRQDGEDDEAGEAAEAADDSGRGAVHAAENGVTHRAGKRGSGGEKSMGSGADVDEGNLEEVGQVGQAGGACVEEAGGKGVDSGQQDERVKEEGGVRCVKRLVQGTECTEAELQEADGVGVCVKDDVKGGVRDGVGDGVRDGVRGGVRDGVRDGVRAGVRHGVRDGVRDGVQDGVRDGVGDGVRNGAHSSMHQRVRNGGQEHEENAEAGHKQGGGRVDGMGPETHELNNIILVEDGVKVCDEAGEELEGAGWEGEELDRSPYRLKKVGIPADVAAVCCRVVLDLQEDADPGRRRVQFDYIVHRPTRSQGSRGPRSKKVAGLDSKKDQTLVGGNQNQKTYSFVTQVMEYDAASVAAVLDE